MYQSEQLELWPEMFPPKEYVEGQTLKPWEQFATEPRNLAWVRDFYNLMDERERNLKAG